MRPRQKFGGTGNGHWAGAHSLTHVAAMFFMLALALPQAGFGQWATATGGDETIIYRDADGEFWQAHIFSTTGESTFEVLTPGEVEVLVVAGGGAGGSGGGGGQPRTAAGGGAAGGLIHTNLTVSAGTHEVVVGAGGASTSGGGDGSQGADGENSNAFGLIALGGGGGGASAHWTSADRDGRAGGSGGGGGAAGNGADGAGGTGLQGFNGGSGFGNGNNAGRAGGGGGGAAANGGNASNGSAGDGGNGMALSITGQSVWYAGGGGGGRRGGGGASGGNGGGGRGGASGAGQPGTNGLGGGGGGGGDFNASGGAGGSGIVVVRYQADVPIMQVSDGADLEVTDGDHRALLTFADTTASISFTILNEEIARENLLFTNSEAAVVFQETGTTTYGGFSIPQNVTTPLLEAGQSASFTVEFTSNEIGEHTATLLILNNDPFRSEFTIDLTVVVAPDEAAPAVSALDGAVSTDSTSATLHGMLTAGGVAYPVNFVWGTEPGSADSAAGWQHVVPVSSPVGSAVEDVPFAETISGLFFGQQYYYMVVAENAEGTATSAIVPFFTQAPDSMSVSLTEVDWIVDTAAVLRGSLSAPDSVFTVTAYWSETDHADEAAWLAAAAEGAAQSSVVGTFTNVVGRNFSLNIRGLTPDTGYYATVIATNAATSLIPSSNVSFETVLTEQVVDLILVSGQSNAVGFDAIATELPPDPRDEQVMFWWRGGATPADSNDSSFNQQWVPLQTQPQGGRTPGRLANFAHSSGGFGPEMGFARTLLDANPDRPLAIVKVAYGATSINSWLPGAGLYNVMMSELNLAVAQAQAMGIALRPVAFLWCQGETDGNREMPTDSYRWRQESLLDGIRRDLDAPEMIALLGFNTRFGKRWTDRNAPLWNIERIRQAQIQVAESSDYTVRVEDWGVQVVNSAHFGPQGTVNVGERYAAAFLELEQELAAMEARLVVSHIDGDTTVTEGGDSDTYRVVLNRRVPEADVTVTMTVDDQVTVSPTSLLFTPSNWNVPQFVTVTAVDDDLHELIHTGTIMHTTSSADPEWDEVSVEFVVTVIDNDNTAPVVNAGPNQTVAISAFQPWTPNLLSLAAWYDASDENMIFKDDSDRVSEWLDQSGNERDVEQFESDAQPLSGTRTLNGLNALAFSGSANQFLSTTESISGQPLTAFAVAQFDAAGSDATVFDGNESERCMLRRRSSGALAAFADSWLDGPVTAAEAVIASVEFNGANSAIRKNGGTAATGNAGTGDMESGLTIGNVSGEPDSNHRMNGLIGELIFLEGTLAEAERQRVEGYLAHKWGLEANLPAGHPYKDAGPEAPIVTAILNGSASDPDGDPLVTTWSVVSGPGPVAFGNSSAVATTATFSMDGTYVLRLTAFDSLDTSYDEVTITVNDTLIAVPTGLEAVVSLGQVDLSWEPANNATSYRVYRSAQSGSGYALVGTTAETSFSETVANGMTFYYVVSAVGDEGESAFSQEAVAMLRHVLPFTEDFEALDLGVLNGQNGWVASQVEVQGTVAIGSKAAEIVSDAGYLAQSFWETETHVRTEFMTQPVFYEDDVDAPPEPDGVTAVLYFNQDGHPVVFDGTSPLTLSGVTVEAGEWVGVAFLHDYVARTWSLYVNNTLAATDLGFYDTTPTHYSSFHVQGGGFIDEISITIADSVQESFEDWISGFNLSERAGFNDDYNQDGVSNGMKFFFGIDPGEPSPGLSNLALDVSDGNRFTFTHPMGDSVPSGIVVEYRWSKDLAAFHADGDTHDGTTVTFERGVSHNGMVTVTATMNGTPTDRIFVTLFVSLIE